MLKLKGAVVRGRREDSCVLEVKETTDVVVDYPAEGESITSPIYTFRIGAHRAEQVDVSIDGGSWRPCRKAEGYWWHDWQGYSSDRHQVVARARRNGETWVTKPRRFKVDLPK